jgi:iron complex outermembrane receptor protein
VGEIKEEKIDSFELGIRGERHGVSYQVAGYYMKKKNFFFRDTDGFNVINGRTKHHGIEAEVVAPLPHGFALAMGGTYARHTYDFDNTVAVNSTESIKRGDDVDTAPRFLSNVRLMWECAENALVEFEWSRIGSYFTDASNLHKYPGHNVFNFRGHWQIQPALRIYGAVTNLTNKRYAERADFSFGTERYLPAESRAFQVGFALDF